MAKMKKTLVGTTAVVVLVGTLAAAGVLGPITTFINGGLTTFVSWTGSVESGITNNAASIDKIVGELALKSEITSQDVIDLVAANAPVAVSDAEIAAAVDAIIEANGAFAGPGGSYTIDSLEQLNQALTDIFSAAAVANIAAQAKADDAVESVEGLAVALDGAFGALDFTPPPVIADFR